MQTTIYLTQSKKLILSILVAAFLVLLGISSGLGINHAHAQNEKPPVNTPLYEVGATESHDTIQESDILGVIPLQSTREGFGRIQIVARDAVNPPVFEYRLDEAEAIRQSLNANATASNETSIDSQAQTQSLTEPKTPLFEKVKQGYVPYGHLLWLLIFTVFFGLLALRETITTALISIENDFRITTSDGIEASGRLVFILRAVNTPEAQLRRTVSGKQALRINIGMALAKVLELGNTLTSRNAQAQLPRLFKEFNWQSIDWNPNDTGYELVNVVMGEGGLNFDEDAEELMQSGAAGIADLSYTKNLFGLGPDQLPTAAQIAVAGFYRRGLIHINMGNSENEITNGGN